MLACGVGFLLLVAAASAKTGINIYSLHIRSDIQLRFATTLITSRVANLANRSNEAVFKVILPEEAFISDFTMEIDGLVYSGVVDEKEAAEKQFQRAKKKGQSTGLVSKEPRDSKSFKVQVNVAAFSKVTFNLTYQELLKRVLGVYQHKVFINPGQPVRDLKVIVTIEESRDITRLYVPRIQTNVNSYRSNRIEDGSPIAVITRPTPSSAYITYSPTVDNQEAASKRGLAGHFIMEYDIERSLDAGDLLVVNGYFVHFLAPTIQEPITNNVLFIIDMSGSMQGSKLDQLKIENKLIQMDVEIKRSLQKAGNADIDKCIAVMEDLDQLPVTYAMLRKNRDIMNTIKKCRKYKGSDQIKKKADYIYSKYKQLFLVGDGSTEIIMKELKEKKLENKENADELDQSHSLMENTDTLNQSNPLFHTADTNNQSFFGNSSFSGFDTSSTVIPGLDLINDIVVGGGAKIAGRGVAGIDGGGTSADRGVAGIDGGGTSADKGVASVEGETSVDGGGASVDKGVASQDNLNNAYSNLDLNGEVDHRQGDSTEQNGVISDSSSGSTPGINSGSIDTNNINKDTDKSSQNELDASVSKSEENDLDPSNFSPNLDLEEKLDTADESESADDKIENIEDRLASFAKASEMLHSIAKMAQADSQMEEDEFKSDSEEEAEERQDLDARIAAIIHGSELKPAPLTEEVDNMYDPAEPTEADEESQTSDKAEEKTESEEEEQVIDDDELHNLLGV